MRKYVPPWELVRKKGAPLDPLVVRACAAPVPAAPPVSAAPSTSERLGPPAVLVPLEIHLSERTGPCLERLGASIRCPGPRMSELSRYWYNLGPSREEAPRALHALRQHLQELTSALNDTIRFEARERWKRLQRLLYVAGVVQYWRDPTGLLSFAFLRGGDECACEYAERG